MVKIKVYTCVRGCVITNKRVNCIIRESETTQTLLILYEIHVRLIK